MVEEKTRQPKKTISFSPTPTRVHLRIQSSLMEANVPNWKQTFYNFIILLFRKISLQNLKTDWILNLKQKRVFLFCFAVLPFALFDRLLKTYISYFDSNSLLLILEILLKIIIILKHNVHFKPSIMMSYCFDKLNKKDGKFSYFYNSIKYSCLQKKKKNMFEK